MKTSIVLITILLILSLIFCGILWANLGITRDELSITSIQLTDVQAQLDVKKNELNNTKMRLSTIELLLDDAQVKLADTETQLQTNKLQLITTQSQLQENKAQLSAVQTQLSEVKNENTQMLNQYSDLRKQINLRLGQGQDSQEFITPDNDKVTAKADEIAGVYSEDNNELWRDYERLYRWVINNIKYSYDSYLPVIPAIISNNLTWVKEFWRMPVETLEDEVGDCEDMAVLLASLMLSYNNQDFSVWAIELKNEDSAHLAVAFPVSGNNLVILDPAGNYYTGHWNLYLQSFDINRAVNDWLSHWAQKIPSAHISGVFSNKLYREFASTDEFINWAKD